MALSFSSLPRRFDNGLLFVLATSNLLVQPSQIQELLTSTYHGLVLLLGPSSMQVEMASKLEALKRKLRALGPLLDVLIMDDCLVPCIMLGAPQVLSLPQRERQDLVNCLDKIGKASGTGLACITQNGWIMAATQDWWTGLKPHEILLLQHLTTHHLSVGGEEQGEMVVDVHLSFNNHKPSTLVRMSLDVGLNLLIVCQKGATDMAEVNAIVEQQATRVQPILQLPAWATSPIPSLKGISFDMCLVHSSPLSKSPSPRIHLFWGRTSEVPQGFNPLMSPTLRKQLLASSGGGGLSSPVAGGGSGGGGSPSLHTRAGGSISALPMSSQDNIQLYYQSCLDMLVSFMLQQRASARTSGSVESEEDEVQLVTSGNRLVALMGGGADIFMVLPRKVGRVEARRSAKSMREALVLKDV